MITELINAVESYAPAAYWAGWVSAILFVVLFSLAWTLYRRLRAPVPPLTGKFPATATAPTAAEAELRKTVSDLTRIARGWQDKAKAMQATIDGMAEEMRKLS